MSNTFSENSQIGIVSTFSELIHTDFKGEMNALCWHRNLDGDFKELVEQLSIKDNITEVYPEDLLALQLSQKGNRAREIILNDLKLLANCGASPSLNLLKCYERDDEFDFISTDVYSFHVDRSPIATDTFLCTYHGAASEIISNNQAEQKILIPEIRKKLKELYDDAYNRKLVKKIQVKGINLKGTSGTNGYLYLENIIVSKDKAPVAQIEYEVRNASGNVKRIRQKLSKVANLFDLSGGMPQYKNQVIQEIDGYHNK